MERTNQIGFGKKPEYFTFRFFVFYPKTHFADRGLINRAELEPLELDQQTEILSKVVRRITYAHQGENIEILLLNGISFTFHAAVKPNYGRHIKRVKPTQNTKEVDRKTYHKALALQIREYMRINNLSQKECAAALGMSPARVSQLVRIDKI